MEFRAGDHIYIPELSEWDKTDYEYGWDRPMNKYCDKEATVELVTNKGYIYLDIDNGYYCWSSNHLQMLKPTSRPLLKVGDKIVIRKPNKIQEANMPGDWTYDDNEYIGQQYTITKIDGVDYFVDEYLAFNECHLEFVTEYEAF